MVAAFAFSVSFAYKTSVLSEINPAFPDFF